MRESERGLLLLCCSLGEEVVPLSSREYKQVMKLLQEGQPEAASQDVTVEYLCAKGLNKALAERVYRLIERSHQPERYLKPASQITVLTRISPDFPHRLRKLGDACPPAIFCKGDLSLLKQPAVSLVGSRMLQARGADFARRIGKLAAEEGYVLVSGNAVGADRVAQDACLHSGGKVISVVPDALERYPLTENQLFLSDEGYELGFSTHRALRRNHLIHALGEKVFVAQCQLGVGGTWAGSRDNLKHGWSPLYILDDKSEGMIALRELGATNVGDFLPSLKGLQPSQLSIFD